MEAEKCDICRNLLSEEEEEVLIQALGDGQCDESAASAVLDWARLVRVSDICLRLLLSKRATINCNGTEFEIISKAYELAMSMIEDCDFEEDDLDLCD